MDLENVVLCQDATKTALAGHFVNGWFTRASCLVRTGFIWGSQRRCLRRNLRLLCVLALFKLVGNGGYFFARSCTSLGGVRTLSRSARLIRPLPCRRIYPPQLLVFTSIVTQNGP